VYLTRPAASPRTRPLRLGAGSGDSSRFETWDWEIWAFRYSWIYEQPPVPGTDTHYFTPYRYDAYRAYRWGKYLESASDVVDGQLAFSTQSVTSGQAVGEVAPSFSTLFNARVVATH
jgi:hypothetical protein